jgi:hypothetical protein
MAMCKKGLNDVMIAQKLGLPMDFRIFKERLQGSKTIGLKISL